MPPATLRVASTGITVLVSDRVLGALFALVGAVLVYLVLFDQGDAAGLLLGTAAAHSNTLHELFHDGRHLFGAQCH